MLFANEYEIQWWVERYAADLILSCAARTLCSLKDAVNSCSDGWAYWPAPARSAQKLITLLADADRADRRSESHPLTVADLDRAYRPIKAFQTRYGATCGFHVALAHPAVESAGAQPLTLFA